MPRDPHLSWLSSPRLIIWPIAPSHSVRSLRQRGEIFDFWKSFVSFTITAMPNKVNAVLCQQIDP
jgi:hypothetical protein